MLQITQHFVIKFSIKKDEKLIMFSNDQKDCQFAKQCVFKQEIFHPSHVSFYTNIHVNAVKNDFSE